MACGSTSAANWRVGEAVEREIDDDVWIPAVVEAKTSSIDTSGSGSELCVTFSVLYSDGSREDFVSGDELRRPPTVPLDEPEQDAVLSPRPALVRQPNIEKEKSKMQAATIRDAQTRHQERSQLTQSMEQGHEEKQDEAMVQTVSTISAENHDTEDARVLAQSRSLLAGGNALCARIDRELDEMQRDTLGATAAVEAEWEHYRAQHDVLGDRLIKFGRSFTAATWEAAATAAGDVMAGLMEGVKLPTPQLEISCDNSHQLLSSALQHEKLRCQQKWCKEHQQQQKQQEHFEGLTAEDCVPGGEPESSQTFSLCSCGDCHQEGWSVWEDKMNFGRPGPSGDVSCNGNGTINAATVTGRTPCSSDSGSTSRQVLLQDKIDWCSTVRKVCHGQQPKWASKLEEFVVQPGDPRLGLIGQRAVRVKDTSEAEKPAPTVAQTSAISTGCRADDNVMPIIPSGSVLLHYAGTVHTQSEFDDRYDYQQRLLNGYVVLLWNNKQPQERDQQLQQEPPPSPISTLLLDGYDGGNSSSMINDYRVNPFHDLRTAEALASRAAESEGVSAGPNVRFCRVFDRGWPYLFIVSLRNLYAGEELLLDYGDDYWESRRQAALGPNQTVPLSVD